MKNLKIAIKSLLNFKLYTFVNIVGLAMSLVCVIIIFRYVYGELTVDRHNSKIDRMYVAVEYGGVSRAGTLSFPGMWTNMARRNFPTERDYLRQMSMGLAAMTDHPAFEKVTHMSSMRKDVTVNGVLYEADFLGVTPEFMDIFDYKLSAGFISKDFDNAGNAVISDKFAAKVFGKNDPLGRQISLSGMQFTITGIFVSPSTKTSVSADILTVVSSSGQIPIVLLPKGSDYRKVNEDLKKYFEDYYSGNRESLSASAYIQLMPLKDLYFERVYDIQGEVQHNYGSRTNVILLLSVGILLLLIGVVNFVNIYTVVIMRRGRELGMKKVFGAGRGAIFAQLFVENIVLVGISLLVALSITEMSSPLVKNLLGLEQIPFAGFDYALAGILLVVLPLLTSTFPYFKYYYSTPISSLRSVGKTGGRGLTRKIFLTFQYVITLFMIVMSLYFSIQLQNMLKADPGFLMENIIDVKTHFVNGISTDEFDAADEVMRSRIRSSPLFTDYVYGETSPINPKYSITKLRVPGGDYVTVKKVKVSIKWLEFFGLPPELKVLPVIADDGNVAYPSGRYAIATQELCSRLNITDWRSAIMEPDYGEGRMPDGSNLTWDLTGKVGHYSGFHIGENFDPVLFNAEHYDELPWYNNRRLFLKVAEGRMQDAIQFLNDLYVERYGKFEYSFLEDDYKAMYSEDRKVATIYQIFTIIAIIVSMLGLFSMSLFDVQQRLNEIAIRKVNGASTGNIMLLLLKKYVSLLLLAFVIASPLVWLTLQRYMQTYAFRTPVYWWLFAVALFITAAISLLTLIFQTYRAAETNPATIIRSE